MQPGKIRGFTIRFKGIVRVIHSECHVGFPLYPSDSKVRPPDQDKKFLAIWDTGATGTVVTQKVVDACGLKPTGMVKVQTVGGERLSETYFITLYLPNKVAVSNINVCRGEVAGADVLIGMDIISLGDFAISNYGGQTVVAFRLPSKETIDFDPSKAKPQSGRILPPPSIPKVGRNAPCPCGSGKKHKRCCGMGA